LAFVRLTLSEKENARISLRASSAKFEMKIKR